MNEPKMIEEQEALLDEAVNYAQLTEQQARELGEMGESFSQEWEKSLRDAESAVASQSED